MEEETKPSVDPFADFLFGARRRTNKEESSVQEKEAYDWVLGRRMYHDEKREEVIETSKSPGPIEKAVQNVNLPELLTHLDTLMTSAQNLKPLYQNIKPLLGQFLKPK